MKLLLLATALASMLSQSVVAAESRPWSLASTKSDSSALGANVKANGNGNGNANGNGNGNGNGSNSGNGNGTSNVNGSANGNANGLSRGNSTAPGQTRTKQIEVLDQDAALAAVKAHQALPLAGIIAIAEATGGGRVIDAKLVRAGGMLLYRLTLLSQGGVTRRIYVRADTGKPVDP
jgi:hypothetical protein